MKKYHVKDDDRLIYSDGFSIVEEGRSSIKKFSVSGVLPDLFSLVKRILRTDIHSIKICNDYLVVILKGKLRFYRRHEVVKEFTIGRGSRPLRNGVVCLNNQLFYGDYWSNPEKLDVNIYRIDVKTLEREIFYSFKHVRHIHFLQEDLFLDNSLLIGTGDSDSESGLFQLNIKTKKLEIILEGSQDTRVVSVIQHKEYLIWGTDAPNVENYIYKYNRKTKELNRLIEIDGPAYYSTITKKGYMYIATTVENRHKHNAIIYESKDYGNNWTEYKKFKKDIWHSKYFGYGIIEFIEGQESSDKLFFNKIGLSELKERLK